MARRLFSNNNERLQSRNIRQASCELKLYEPLSNVGTDLGIENTATLKESLNEQWAVGDTLQHRSRRAAQLREHSSLLSPRWK